MESSRIFRIASDTAPWLIKAGGIADAVYSTARSYLYHDRRRGIISLAAIHAILAVSILSLSAVRKEIKMPRATLHYGGRSPVVGAWDAKKQI
jgi:hypothetical protein